MENSIDTDNHEVSLETVYSSLAHYNFPGQYGHAKDIMPASVDDVPRIRTWTEYNPLNGHEDPLHRPIVLILQMVKLGNY